VAVIFSGNFDQDPGSGPDIAIPDKSIEIWSRVLGISTCFSVGAAFVSPRTIPFAMAIGGSAIVVAALLTRQVESLRPRLNAAEWAIVAILAYGAAALIWADSPSAGVIPLAFGIGYFAGYLLDAAVVRSADRRFARRIAEGLCIGLAFGLVYLGLEIFSAQSVKLALYRDLHVPRSWLRPARDFHWGPNGDLLSIEPSDLTRNIAPITLLLWSALLATKSFFRSENLARTLCWSLFILSVLVILKSEHETSKAALLFAVIIFIVARLSTVWSGRLLMLGWCFSCLAVIPCVMTLYRMGVQKESWVQPSMQARVEIWNSTAEQIMKSPIFGHGARAMYDMRENKADESEYTPLAPHAHNVFLQMWFEMGVIGAAMLTLMGLALIGVMGRLPEAVVPYAHATFTSAAAVAAASYGTWQPWFIAMFVMCPVMFMAALRSREDAAATANLSKP